MPFTYLEIHDRDIYGCCPSWLTIPYGKTSNLNEVWNGEVANLVRESILDGTYKYCSKTECPYLSQFIIEGTTKAFKKKENVKLNLNGPSSINFAFDRSCNLSCPSCRKDIFIPTKSDIQIIEEKNNNIINVFGKSIKTLYLCGSADPFASKTLKNMLLNFDRSKFPNIKHIHLHTNGLLLTEEMWNKLSHIHDLIHSIEISVDAATKETYEKIRRGGKWEILLKNLEFISTLKLSDVRLSFVVQDSNYMEMCDFNNLVIKLFNYNATTYFNKITNWGTYTESEFQQKQIWNESHPYFNKFLIELNKIVDFYNCRHNMYDIIEKYLDIKKPSKLI
jgi:MoaA/NifB/PqqE/SkfB family radical SAM enzyme